MDALVRHGAMVFWTISLGLLLGGCSFDTSGPGFGDSRFEGVWQGTDANGNRMLLELLFEPQSTTILGGTLIVGEGMESTIYSLDGLVKSTGWAELTGTIVDSGQQDTITALLTSDNTMTVTVNDGPPSNPLLRVLSPEQVFPPDEVFLRWR